MVSVPPQEEWTKTFETLKEFHDLAYRNLDDGIQLETEGKRELALQKYEEGLRLMDLALELRIECPQNADFTWEKACVMIQKLKKTRKDVLSRIAEIQVTKPEDPSLAPPPTYEEAMSLPSPTIPLAPSSNHSALPSTSAFTSLPATSAGSSFPTSSQSIRNGSHITYAELGEALSSLKLENDMQSAEVICSYNNVRIYFIRPDGTVTSPYEPQTLRVLQLERGGNDAPKNYLQAGDWFYPMVPNVSPCLHTSYGAYILHDVNSQEPGASVGLVFPPDTDETMRELIGDMMQNVVPEEKLPLKKEVPLSVQKEEEASRSNEASGDTVTIPEKPLPTSTKEVNPTPKPTSTTRFSRDIVSGTHKHHKISLGKGARRKHRHDNDHNNLDDREGEVDIVDGDSRKHKHGHRHRGHRRHHRHHDNHPPHDQGQHNHRDDKDNYGDPPPYDEIGKEAEDMDESDEDEIEEVAGVEVDGSERSSRKHGRGKYSRRHKRFAYYSRDRPATSFEKGCRFISSSLIKGAEKASEFLDSTTPKVIEKVTPEQNPHSVPPSVVKGLEVTKDITSTAANVTGYVAGKIGSATMSVCRTVAPHIKKQGTRLLTTAGYKQEDAANCVDGVLEIAADCFEGVGSVYEGLGESASILSRSIGNNTVKVVGHKYGQSMGEATSHTLATVGNVLDITQNAKILTFKGMRKTVIKGTGKAVISEYSTSTTNFKEGESSQYNLNGKSKTDSENHEKDNHTSRTDDPSNNFHPESSDISRPNGK